MVESGRRAGLGPLVSGLGGMSSPPFVADLHFEEGFGPAGDNAVDGDFGGVFANGAVEAAIEEHAVVMDADHIGGFRRSGAGFDNEVLQAAFGRDYALLAFVRDQKLLQSLRFFSAPGPSFFAMY